MEGLPGFRTLPAAARERVAAAGRLLEVPRGTRLFAAGDPSAHVWALKEGSIHIVHAAPDGREVVLEVISPGELFGAVVALDDVPYPASAVAALPSIVWAVPSALVRELCQRHPTLRGAILGHAMRRLRAAHDRLRSLALEPVEQRLARALLLLCERVGVRGRDGTTVAVTRQELADMAGTTVETAIRITTRWQRVGLVHGGRSRLQVLDLAALRHVAHGDVAGEP